MTKEQLEQKIKEILSEDKRFNGAKIEVVYKDKKQTLGNKSVQIVQLRTKK